MVEVIGDPVQPSELILPTPAVDSQPTKIGALFMSGGNVMVFDGSAAEVVGGQT